MTCIKTFASLVGKDLDKCINVPRFSPSFLRSMVLKGWKSDFSHLILAVARWNGMETYLKTSNSMGDRPGQKGTMTGFIPIIQIE